MLWYSIACAFVGAGISKDKKDNHCQQNDQTFEIE